MKVQKSFDIDAIKKYGFTPSGDMDIKAEMENQFTLMEESINNNISQRNNLETFSVCGLMISLPRSVEKTAETLCSIDGERYPFLYKAAGNDFLKNIVSHYLFGGRSIGREERSEVIKRSKEACRKIGLQPDKNSNDDCLKTWLIYKCNNIISSFTA